MQKLLSLEKIAYLISLFLAEKPIGENITSFMRPEPFHIIDLYIAAIVICYAIYLPYYLRDRSRGWNVKDKKWNCFKKTDT